MVDEPFDIASVHVYYGTCHYDDIDQETLFEYQSIDDGAGCSCDGAHGHPFGYQGKYHHRQKAQECDLPVYAQQTSEGYRYALSAFESVVDREYVAAEGSIQAMYP